MVVIGLAILSCSSACSEQAAQPVATPKSRFTQEGLDAISIACGLRRGSLLLEGASSVRFGSGVAREYKKFRCVQMKIRETYYPGAKAAFVGNERHQQEGKDAQTH